MTLVMKRFPDWLIDKGIAREQGQGLDKGVYWKYGGGTKWQEMGMGFVMICFFSLFSSFRMENWDDWVSTMEMESQGGKEKVQDRVDMLEAECEVFFYFSSFLDFFFLLFLENFRF